MKKIVFVLAIVLAMSMCACGKIEVTVSKVETPANNDNVKPPKNDIKEPEKKEPTVTQKAGTYDVDLTKMSSTMVYAEVYNMMYEPEKYVGKSVRMNGQFVLYQLMDENGYPVEGQIYYACLVADATACCSQGLEFVLAGDYKYPDDYPPLGNDIIVSGRFETYDEDGYTYCHLVDAKLEQKNA